MKKLVKRITATIFTVVLIVSSIGNHTIKAYAAEESLVEEMEAMAAAQAQAEAEAAAQAEAERIAAEQAAAQAEAERIAAEQAAAQAEAERIAAEQAAAEAAAAAQAEAERIAAEQAAQAQAQAEAEAKAKADAEAAAKAQAEAAAQAEAGKAAQDGNNDDAPEITGGSSDDKDVKDADEKKEDGKDKKDADDDKKETDEVKKDGEDKEKKESEEKDAEPVEATEKEYTVTIFYEASEGGKVSVEKETLTWKEITTVDKDGKETVEKEPETVKAKGSKATADKKFEFTGWTLNGETVSEDETFVPQVPVEDITYKAQFLDKEEEYPAQSWTGETADVRVSASVDEGVFPEDTEMKVAPVSKQAVINASQELTDENTEVVDAVGADITFYNKDGEEIQPKGAVNVSLSAKRTLEGENQYAVTVDDGGNASVVADANANGANIVTDHFTVYGIYTTEYNGEDQDVEQFVRYTYRFFMSEEDTEPFYTQILKQVTADGAEDEDAEDEDAEDEDAEDDVLKVPALPAGDGKTECEGWFARDTEGKLTIQITSGLKVPGEDESGEDKVFDVYPKYNTQFEVIYYVDAEKSAVLDTVTVSGESHEVDKKLDPEDGDKEAFIGWKKDTDKGEPPTILTEVNAADTDEDGIVRLVPVWEEYHILYFDGNGADAGSYQAKVRVKHDATANQAIDEKGNPVNAVNANAAPERDGYTFHGWYETFDPADEEEPFDFNTPITKSMTFYAKWEAEMRTFTVEVREENANGNDYTTVLVEEMETVKKDSGPDASYTNIPIEEIIAKYCDAAKKGFHLNGTGAYDTEGNQRYRKDANFADNGAAIEVLQGGSVVASYDAGGSLIGTPGKIDWSKDAAKVVVYVNYSRDQYKLFFRFEESISKNPGHITDGCSAQGSWRMEKTATINGKNVNLEELAPEYEGQPLLNLQGESIFYIKYGESLYECVYKNSPKIKAFMEQGDPWYFLTDYYRDIKGQAVFDETNPMNVFKPMTGAEDGQGLVCLILYKPGWATFPIRRIFHRNDGRTWDYTLRPEYYKDHNHTFAKGSVYQAGYCEGDSEFQGYIIDRVEGGNLKKGTWETGETCTFTFKETDDPKVRQTLEVHYYPTTYTITFDLNGVAVNGSTADILKTGINAGTNISGVEPGVTTGTKDGKTYVFKGWYTYPTCPAGTEAVFSGKTMPPYNLTYYAKWEPANLDVTFYPENGEDSFTKQVAPNGKVAFEGAPKGSAEGKTFKYWAVKDANDKPVKFDFATSITEHIDLYAVWEAPEEPYKVKYVTDTEKGALPAGLAGITTDEETKTQSGFDQVSYKKNAQAALFGKASPEKGFVFTGWLIGETVLDGNNGNSTFKISDYVKDGETVVTLVAQYAAVSEKTTKVIYHANYPPNGGKDGAATENTVEEALVSKDESQSKKKIAVNGSFLIDENDETCGFIPEGSFRFVCWTNEAGATLFSERDGREIFYEGDLAGAQAKGNNLYALWEAVQEVVEPAPGGIGGGDEPDPTPTTTTTTTTTTITLADIPAQDPEDLPSPENTIPGDLPAANAPGVLGQARRTSTLDTMTGAQVRNYDEPDVLGSRRGKTGEQSDATRMMTIMGAGIILAALARDKRRREKEE